VEDDVRRDQLLALLDTFEQVLPARDVLSGLTARLTHLGLSLMDAAHVATAALGAAVRFLHVTRAF